MYIGAEVIWLATVVVALATIGRGWRRHAPIARIGCELVFLGYLAGVASVTLFPIILEPGFIQEMRQTNDLADGINLLPLAGLGVIDGTLGHQVFLNVLLGVPFGFSMPFLGVIAARRVVAFGVVFAVSIELVQLAIDVAYQFGYRTVDINDVISNVVGVTIGFGLFRFVRLAYGALKFKSNDVGDYLHGVLSP
ncbi:MAG: hypothetical protein EPO00_08610 [Chloroflexota bacterium]|nr:MAG: hypothetical protein EPO00_08610 [Chloroflexota bacterium]